MRLASTGNTSRATGTEPERKSLFQKLRTRVLAPIVYSGLAAGCTADNLHSKVDTRIPTAHYASKEQDSAVQAAQEWREWFESEVNRISTLPQDQMKTAFQKLVQSEEYGSYDPNYLYSGLSRTEKNRLESLIKGVEVRAHPDTIIVADKEPTTSVK